KKRPQADGHNESSKGGEAGGVGASSAKHALPFGARAALARTDSTRPGSPGPSTLAARSGE
ncbi:hypothetical protein, partial [Edaphobacter sp.]|uniref:hypothetical protein n=1 Tax=Edaphobacter sp. TaxID=1934404 RepID=UPI002DBB915C